MPSYSPSPSGHFSPAKATGDDGGLNCGASPAPRERLRREPRLFKAAEAKLIDSIGAGADGREGDWSGSEMTSGKYDTSATWNESSAKATESADGAVEGGVAGLLDVAGSAMPGSAKPAKVLAGAGAEEECKV